MIITFNGYRYNYVETQKLKFLQLLEESKPNMLIFTSEKQVKYLYKDLNFDVIGFITVYSKKITSIYVESHLNMYIYFDLMAARIVLIGWNEENDMSNIKDFKNFLQHLHLRNLISPSYTCLAKVVPARYHKWDNHTDSPKRKIYIPKNYYRPRLVREYHESPHNQGVCGLLPYSWKKDKTGSRQMPEVLRELRLVLDVKDYSDRIRDPKVFKQLAEDLTSNYNRFIHQRLKNIGLSELKFIDTRKLDSCELLLHNLDMLYKMSNSKSNI